MPRTSKRRMREDDLFRLVIPNSPSLSPDGKTIVYAVKKMDPKENRYISHLYSVSTSRGAPKQLTTGNHLDSEPVWSPDGKWIAFVSKRSGEKIQIWLLPADGGEARQLTDLSGGPIRSLAWSPDGRTLLFHHRIEEQQDSKESKKKATFKHITRLRHKLDGDGYWPKERWHVWTVSVPGGRAKQITFGENDDWNAIWSPDGRRIAFVSNRIEEADYHPDNSDIFIVTPAGGRPRQVTRRFGSADNPAWSADGKTIYYIGNFGKDGEWNKLPLHIYSIPTSGRGNTKDLTRDFDYWFVNGNVTDTAMSSFDGVLLPYVQDGEERLAVMVTIHGGCRVYSLSTSGGPLRREFTEKINAVGVSVNRHMASAAVVAARMMDAGDVYNVPLDGSQEVKRLTQHNRAFFNSLDLTEPEETVFRNGRVNIQGWILKPPRFRKDRKYPMLLEVHGGPMCQYGYTFFHEMHFLAAQGYVVAFCNPRGSDGYGTKFRSCIDGKWGTVDYADCMAVVDTMARKRYIDSKRLGILGGSYGGFMTTWAVGHTNRFKAAVTQRQAGNFFTFFGSSDFGFYNYFEYKVFPWEKPQTYLKYSPNYYVGNIETPLLVIHSEQDYRCPLNQAEELFVALKMRRKTVELVQFEGESHGLSRGGRPQNRKERLNRIADWFRRYL